MFDNLKKRYSRIRNQYKKSRRSGAGRADVQKNEDHLNQYSFLFWLNPFIKLRKTKNNLSDDESGEDRSFEDDRESETQNVVDNVLDDDIDNGPHDDADEEDEMNQNIETSPSSPAVNTFSFGFKRQSDSSETPREAKKSRSKVTGHEKWVKKNDKQTPDVETQLLTTIDKRLSTMSPSSRDEHDVFGEMISKEMRGFSKALKFQFKHEVNDLLYKYQLQQLREEGTDVTATTSTIQFQSQSNSAYPLFNYYGSQIASPQQLFAFNEQGKK